MKPMKNMIAIILVAFLAFSLTQNVFAQSSGGTQTFFSNDYPGISITVKANATGQVEPSKNMTIELLINCTAIHVVVNRLNVSVYGFRNGTEETLLGNITFISNQTNLALLAVVSYKYSIPIPNDVWDSTYTQVYLNYQIASEPHEYSPSFYTTAIKNIYLEKLEAQLNDLNASYLRLSETYWRLTSAYKALNASYWQINGTYKTLNESYWQLQKNYTSLKGTSADLDNTRRAVGVLAVTTVFFVASTIYLVLRKPREPW